MYQRILVTLDTTVADETILRHIRDLARLTQARLHLLHVADGWAARLHKTDAVSPEITADLQYLARRQGELAAEGFSVESHLAFGDPVAEIVKCVAAKRCDLIAMATHGHGLVADLIFGTTANRVQHQVDIPVLMLRVKK